VCQTAFPNRQKRGGRNGYCPVLSTMRPKKKKKPLGYDAKQNLEFKTEERATVARGRAVLFGFRPVLPGSKTAPAAPA